MCVSFIPAILLAWGADYVSAKLKNERFQRLRKHKLFNVLQAVYYFFSDCTYFLDDIDDNRALSWQDWHSKLLECLEKSPLEKQAEKLIITENLREHVQKLSDEVNAIRKLFSKGDLTAHEFLDEKDIGALISLDSALKSYKKKDTFEQSMADAIKNMQELSFLAKPFSRSEFKQRSKITYI